MFVTIRKRRVCEQTLRWNFNSINVSKPIRELVAYYKQHFEIIQRMTR